MVKVHWKSAYSGYCKRSFTYSKMFILFTVLTRETEYYGSVLFLTKP